MKLARHIAAAMLSLVIVCQSSGSLFVTSVFPHVSLVLTSRAATPAAVVSAMPEPATLALLGSGLLGMAARWRRRATPVHRG